MLTFCGRLLAIIVTAALVGGFVVYLDLPKKVHAPGAIYEDR